MATIIFSPVMVSLKAIHIEVQIILGNIQYTLITLGGVPVEPLALKIPYSSCNIYRCSSSNKLSRGGQLLVPEVDHEAARGI